MPQADTHFGSFLNAAHGVRAAKKRSPLWQKRTQLNRRRDVLAASSPKSIAATPLGKMLRYTKKKLVSRWRRRRWCWLEGRRAAAAWSISLSSQLIGERKRRAREKEKEQREASGCVARNENELFVRRSSSFHYRPAVFAFCAVRVPRASIDISSRSAFVQTHALLDNIAVLYINCRVCIFVECCGPMCSSLSRRIDRSSFQFDFSLDEEIWTRVICCFASAWWARTDCRHGLRANRYVLRWY